MIECAKSSSGRAGVTRYFVEITGLLDCHFMVDEKNAQRVLREGRDISCNAMAQLDRTSDVETGSRRILELVLESFVFAAPVSSTAKLDREPSQEYCSRH